MDNKGRKVELPKLNKQLNSNLKNKAVTDRHSRNINSMQGLNDLKIKELLTTYTQPQQATTLTGSRSNFNSFDKTHQGTNVASTTDINLHNLLKFKHYFNPLQLSHTQRTIKTKPLINNKISIFKASKKPSNNKKTPTIFYLTKGLKLHTKQQTNNVMNIVNNLNEDNPSLTGRSHKNVEINFNKYEIKILSNKRDNHHHYDERKKIRIKTPLKREMIISKKKSLTNDENILMENLKAENKCCFTSRSGFDSERQVRKEKSQIDKQSLTDNDDSDSTNKIICLKQPVEDLQMVELVNRKIIKNHNTQVIFRRSVDQAKTINVVHEEKKRNTAINDNKMQKQFMSDDDKNPTIVNSNKTLKEDKDNCNEPIPQSTLTIVSAPDQIQKHDPETIAADNPIESNSQFKCYMMITTQSCFSYEGNPLKPQIEEDLKQKEVKTEDKPVEDHHPPNNFTSILLNSHNKNANPCKYSLLNSRKPPNANPDICVESSLLKLNFNYNTPFLKRDSSNSRNHSRSKEIDKSNEIDKSPLSPILSPKSKFGRSKRMSQGDHFFESKLEPLIHNIVDSSDLSIDDCVITKQNSTQHEMKCNSNQNIKRISLNETSKNFLSENFSSEIGHSTKTCNKVVTDTSACGFLLKRATSTLLKKKQKNEITFQLKNNKRMLSPKKVNKRFVKQLSKITEISHTHKILPTRKLSKINRSSSLPLMKIEKISHYQSLKEPSRQLTQLALPTTKYFNISYEEESPVGKKKKKDTVIPEEEQISLTLHSNESSYDERKSIKKPSVLSNSTSGINFYDLRTNSIQISTNLNKCLLPINQEQCQKFISKSIEAIKEELDDIDYRSIDSKNCLIEKSTKSISLLQETLDKKRMDTVSEYVNEALKRINFLQHFDEKDFLINLPDEEDNDNDDRITLMKQLETMNEHDYYDIVFDEIYHTRTYDTLKFLSFRKWFEVNLIYHLDKEKYLLSDFIESEETLINNFKKKKVVYHRLKSSVNTKNNKLFQHMATLPRQLSKRDKKKAEVPIVINAVYCFRFIKLDDYLFHEKHTTFNDLSVCPIKKRIKQSVRKSIQYTESSFSKKRMYLLTRPYSRKGSLSVQRTIDFDKTPTNFYKDSLLEKPLYFRRRRVLKRSKVGKDKTMNLKIVESKLKEDELYKSPYKITRNKKKKETLLPGDLLRFNKETVMFKTHQIKSQLLTEMNTHVDSLFFYIKDSNHQSFADIFHKYKVNIESKDSNGNSFLNLAVQCGCEKIIVFLMSNGANVNTQNSKLNSPLHYALTYQNFVISDLLIKYGADESLKNRLGLTPWQTLNNAFSIV